MEPTKTRLAWERFQSGAHAPIRPEIGASWRRSRSSGVDPDRLDLTHSEVDLKSPFVRTAAPVLLGMADLLTGSSTSLALSATDGTVTWRWESERTLTRDLDRIEFEPGSQVAEQSAGTNGIGIAATTHRPSLVIGAEHYKQLWHPWACVAAPVIHPITRRVAGMVNVACRAEDANSLLLVAVRALVDGVAGALRDAATARQRRMLDAHLSFRSASTAPVVTIDRRTMIIEDDAAELGLDRAALWAAVVEAGPSATEIVLAGSLRARFYPVTRGRLDDGVVLVLTRGSTSESGTSAPGPGFAGGLGPLEQAELRVITDTLAQCDGNKSEAAARLGISRGTLYQRLRRYHQV
ncbi:helix-turn-helix domain-containing protein [Amycolatopsis sp. GM8]|uniref:helix-turn-helix domain-containing protein n=1 Tax=Amycolatopsis sp. GM8 TaxID=2896530 RepID=UPI001F28F015|nr:helix-turn-helix domain-containing protein [Amycolatopsis sp. GM8]